MTDDGATSPGARIGTALAQRLEAEFGGVVGLVEPMTSSGAGFDSDIYFLRLTGARLPTAWARPLVLRVKPHPDAITVARREAAIQDWVADRGYPTPRVLRVFAAGELGDRPVQVMERAEGKVLIDLILRAPWRARRLLADMARLQVQLHDLDPHGFPDGPDLLDNRLGLTRRTADLLEHGPLHSALDRVAVITPQLRGAPPAVCHGDYHPLNILATGSSMSVIDWSDAGVGDRYGDIARTLLLYSVAHIAASNAVERAVFRIVGPILGRTHRRAYERLAPLDDRRIALWTPVHLLHGWSQAIGAHAGIFEDGDTRVDSADRIPRSLVDDLGRRFDDAIAAVS